MMTMEKRLDEMIKTDLDRDFLRLKQTALLTGSELTEQQLVLLTIAQGLETLAEYFISANPERIKDSLENVLAKLSLGLLGTADWIKDQV